MSSCVECGDGCRSFPCPHCLEALYCSASCRAAHWSTHGCPSVGATDTFPATQRTFTRLLRYLATYDPPELLDVMGVHMLSMEDLENKGIVTWVFYPMNDVSALGVANRSWARALRQIAIQAGSVYGAVDQNHKVLCSFIV